MTEDYEYLTCCTCGVRFAGPAHMIGNARKTGNYKIMVYCVNGHSQGWGESELDRVRQERDRLKQTVAEKDDSIKAARDGWDRAVRDKDRIEKRAKAALCPCCNRSFGNLARHMATKHPDQNVMPIGKYGSLRKRAAK